MITAAGLVPHPPLLLRELVGAQDPVADLRAACRATVGGLAADATSLAVVGGADRTQPWDPAAGFAAGRFGRSGGSGRPGGSGLSAQSGGPGTLPLSLGVGLRLLGEAGWDGPVVARSLAWGADEAALSDVAAELGALPGRTAVLVLGDGSARRSEKAPGYLDERAFPFDDAVAKALADGEPAGLAGLDVTLAAELMVHGAAAFRFLGTLGLRQPRRPAATLAFREDPFGVDYLAATWRFG